MAYMKYNVATGKSPSSSTKKAVSAKRNKQGFESGSNDMIRQANTSSYSNSNINQI